eukprot:s331_g7.t1
MGTKSSKTGYVYEDKDLTTEKEGAPVKYTDGDVDDQAAQEYVEEAYSPYCACVVPFMFTQAFGLGTKDGAVSYTFLGPDLVPVSDANEWRGDQAERHFIASYIKEEGGPAADNSPQKAAAKELMGAPRQGTLVDLSAASKPYLPYEVNASLINKIASYPGSRSALQANIAIVRNVLGLSGKSIDPLPFAIQLTINGCIGQHPNVLFLGSDNAQSLLDKLGVDVDLDKTYASSELAAKVDRRCYAIGRRFQSRSSTVALLRAHTLGGYLVSDNDALATTDQSRGAKPVRGQKSPDSIVKRCGDLAKLDPKNTAEANCLYNLCKTLSDPFAMGLTQMAGSYAHKGVTSDAGGPLSAHASKLRAASDKGSYFVRTFIRGDFEVGARGEARKVAIFSSWVHSVEDLTCVPRRAGGLLGVRGLVKAYSDIVDLGNTGVFIACGAMPEMAIAAEAGKVAVASPQLQHPAVGKYLPLSLRGLQEKALAMSVKKSVQIVATIAVRFNEGRFGTEWLNKQNIVASVEKALEKWSSTYGDSAVAYGKTFAALRAEDDAFKVLRAAASKGMGRMSNDMDVEQATELLQKSMAKVLEIDEPLWADKDGNRVEIKDQALITGMASDGASIHTSCNDMLSYSVDNFRGTSSTVGGGGIVSAISTAATSFAFGLFSTETAQLEALQQHFGIPKEIFTKLDPKEVEDLATPLTAVLADKSKLPELLIALKAADGMEFEDRTTQQLLPKSCAVALAYMAESLNEEDMGKVGEYISPASQSLKEFKRVETTAGKVKNFCELLDQEFRSSRPNDELWPSLGLGWHTETANKVYYNGPCTHLTSLHVLGIQVHVHVILLLRDALCVLHIMLHAMFPCMTVPACWDALLMN